MVHSKAVKHGFHLFMLLLFAILWISISQCLECPDNSDAFRGTDEMYASCTCPTVLHIYDVMTIGSVGIELWVWKPWNHIQTMYCSSMPWAVGAAMIVPTILHMAITLVAFFIPVIVFTNHPYFREGGVIEYTPENSKSINGSALNTAMFACVGLVIFTFSHIMWRDKMIDGVQKHIMPPPNVPNRAENAESRIALVAKTGKVVIEKWKQYLMEIFGDDCFHFKLVFEEFIEVGIQLNYMISVSKTVPTNEWLLAMCGLALCTLLSMIVVVIPCLRHREWSYKFLIGVEAVSDLIFLWFSAYAFVYFTPRSSLARSATDPIAAYIGRLLVGLMNYESILDLLPMYLTIARLMYLSYDIYRYVLMRCGIMKIENMDIGPGVEDVRLTLLVGRSSMVKANNAVYPVPMIGEGDLDGGEADGEDDVSSSDSDEETYNVEIVPEPGCGSKILKTFQVIVKVLFYSLSFAAITGCVGFLAYYPAQYYRLSSECLAEWGDEVSKWCTAKTYFSNGVLGKPECGCRIIEVPNCQDGRNKTVDGRALEVLGEHAVALYGMKCNLVGEIPSTIGSMKKLEFVAMQYNHLNGSIPDSIGKCENLDFLGLIKNQFSGPIPSSIGYLPKLQILHLSSNQFEGEIPSSLQNLNGTLFEITLYDNEGLNGTFPLDLGEFFFFKKYYTAKERLGLIEEQVLRGTNITIDSN